jgi:SAM-dependent methyltransferase
VCELHPDNPADYEPWEGKFDTALCVNVLETVQDPEKVLASLRCCLIENGVVLVLVPQGKALYGPLDQAMGHLRRYSAAELSQNLERAGFRVERMRQLNKVGALAWWISGKLLGRKKLSRPALKLFDKTVWFWRRVDRLLPWRGLSLIAVARRV